MALVTQGANRLRRGGGSVVVNANGTISIVGDVALTGIMTATSFSGPMTGDVTGNADTATVLQTARTINGVSFDGSGNIVVTAAAGTLTGTVLKSTVVSSSLTSLGTIASLVASAIAVGGDLTFSAAGGNLAIGTAVLATTATDGFIYISTSAGVPTGVPSAFSGRAPIHWDSTNDILYVYDSGWNQVTGGGGSGDITRVDITAGIGLIGGLNTTSGDHIQTLDFDATSLPALASGLLATDHLAVSDGAVSKKALISGINLGIFNNDQGWTANAGDITRVDIAAGIGLLGDLNTTSGDHVQTLDFDATSLAELTTGLLATDHLVVSDGTVSKKALISGIDLGVFNNDQSWTANAGTVTDVTGGVGVDSSGGATPDLTLDLDELTALASGLLATDHIAVADGANSKKALISGISLSIFDNDLAVTIEVSITVFGPTDDVTVGDGAAYISIPSAPDGFNLTAVHAEVITAGTTGTTDIQIHNINGAANMLSTGITIDSTETGSDTAAAAAVIDTAQDDVAEFDVIRIDVDAVSTTKPKGLIVRLTFELP